jgi:uncharacterized protein (TIGR03086 family)
MNPSDQSRPSAEAFAALVAGIGPDQLDNPTPCAGWSVRDLLNHVYGAGNLFAAIFAGREPAPAPDSPVDLVGDNPLAAWLGVVDALGSAVDSPGALDRIAPMPWGPTPTAVLYELVKMDLLVHGWDLAQATGQTYDPAAEVVDPVLASARQIIAPEMRFEGGPFAAEVAAPADARPLQRLAAFTGRAIATGL